MRSLRSLRHRSIFVFIILCGGPLAALTGADSRAEAQRKLRQHDLNGAFEIVQKADAQKPVSIELASALGNLDFLRGEILDAEMDFKRALRLKDKLARADRPWQSLRSGSVPGEGESMLPERLESRSQRP
jgi:hypothetical protein